MSSTRYRYHNDTTVVDQCHHFPVSVAHKISRRLMRNPKLAHPNCNFGMMGVIMITIMIMIILYWPAPLPEKWSYLHGDWRNGSTCEMCRWNPHLLMELEFDHTKIEVLRKGHKGAKFESHFHERSSLLLLLHVRHFVAYEFWWSKQSMPKNCCIDRSTNSTSTWFALCEFERDVLWWSQSRWLRNCTVHEDDSWSSKSQV